MKDIKIAPSLLSADFSCLEKDIRKVEDVEWLHLDVMDGHFVPNITIGPCVIGSIREVSDHVFDTHLMISDPSRYVSSFADCGSDLITFHSEATEEPNKVIEKIKDHGIKAGISIKPGTHFDEVKHLMKDIDLLLIMTVEPGFGGQSFMTEMLPKIKEAREFIEERGLDVDISVDGGISPETAPEAVKAGANVLVSGSSIFEGDIKKNIRGLRKAVSDGYH